MFLGPTVLVPFPPPAPPVCVFTASFQLYSVLRILAEQAGMQVKERTESQRWTDALAGVISLAPAVVFADLDTPGGFALAPAPSYSPSTAHNAGRTVHVCQSAATLATASDGHPPAHHTVYAGRGACTASHTLVLRQACARTGCRLLL